MALDDVRDPRRAAVAPSEATMLPGAPSDERTIIKRLKKKHTDPQSLQGFVTYNGAARARPRYGVYVDQFRIDPPRQKPAPTAGRQQRDAAKLRERLQQVEDANAALRTTQADLEARLAESLDANEQLRSKLAYTEAEHARDREIIRVLAAANALTADAAEDIQESGEAYKMAAEKAMSASGKYLKVTQMQQDLLGQYFTPNDLSDLPESS